jgi:peptidoglycan biosynthesis protein MviN/MurJ (putative lipid II flippase)
VAPIYGGLAQLARALAWHARGHRFDPDILHNNEIKAFRKLEAFIVLENTIIQILSLVLMDQSIPL